VNDDMADDETMDAPELIALLAGAIYALGQAHALAQPAARMELALYGTTHHEVRGMTWTHVTREVVPGWVPR
jgi:hypothetical protein